MKRGIAEQDERAAFELLDEQEGRGARPLWRRVELLIGVLLLVAVAGWSGWDWWRQEDALLHYRAGVRAAAAYEWEAARLAFLAAGDFNDAGPRAAAAARKIRERDETYAAATTEQAAGQWAAALRDFRQVQSIAPGFRASAPGEQQAAQHVAMLALSGVVALREPTNATMDPPGLYLYLADRWNYLPDSDLSSEVRSSSRYACLVYDAPLSSRPEERLAPGRTAITATAARDFLPPRRRLLVARHAGSRLVVQPLALDVGEFARFTCDDTGVRGESYPAAADSYLDVRLAYVHHAQRYTAGYQAYNSTTIARVPLPGAAWAILADNGHKRLAIGDYSNVLGYHPQTSLYVTDPGGQLAPVAVRQALVQAAWLSPDGRYLLVDEFTPQSTEDKEHRLVLLRTAGDRPPRVLMSTKHRDVLVVGGVWYDAAFISSGVFAGKLLIERKVHPGGELRLLDPDQPDKTVWSGDQIDYVNHLQVWGLREGLLLPFSSQATTVLPAFYLDAGFTSEWLALPLRYGETLAAAQEIDGRLVYAYLNPLVGAGDLLSSVQSIGLPGGTAAAVPAELIAPGRRLLPNGPNTEHSAPSGQRWRFGPGLLAYLDQGQLLARTYDGAITLPLEAGVLRLYDP